MSVIHAVSVIYYVSVASLVAFTMYYNYSVCAILNTGNQNNNFVRDTVIYYSTCTQKIILMGQISEARPAH